MSTLFRIVSAAQFKSPSSPTTAHHHLPSEFNISSVQHSPQQPTLLCSSSQFIAASVKLTAHNQSHQSQPHAPPILQLQLRFEAPQDHRRSNSLPLLQFSNPRSSPFQSPAKIHSSNPRAAPTFSSADALSRVIWENCSGKPDEETEIIWVIRD
ncbi:hypothetical protein M0R45_031643 [Rubus argutus]|uniref:Uncharacterized protein n=1 Tax=Rubus argutus TaxID=59490 RepID=A0AAW1WF22_RUBAR